MKKVRISIHTSIILVVTVAIFYARWAEGQSQKKHFYEIQAEKDIKEEEELEERAKYKSKKSKEEHDKEVNERIVVYKTYEDVLKNFKHYPKEYDLASVMGGINYAMTLDEMKQKVKEVFAELKKKGLIISKSAFEKIKDKYYLRPDNTNNLTRIWGIEYLKKRFDESDPKKSYGTVLKKHYGVPDYILVVDNPDKVKINLAFYSDSFPIPSVLENGTIYLEAINGKGVANEASSYNDLSGIGYADFSDPGNIIEEGKTGKRYVVDTEFKSFKFPITKKLNELLGYAREKFIYLNNGISMYEFVIDL